MAMGRDSENELSEKEKLQVVKNEWGLKHMTDWQFAGPVTITSLIAPVTFWFCTNSWTSYFSLLFGMLALYVIVGSILVHLLSYATQKWQFYPALHPLDRAEQGSPLPLDQSTSNHTTRSNSVMLVTAHPDDESLFFVPTIICLQRYHNNKIYLSVFCKGKLKTDPASNHRIEELYKAVDMLHIPRERVFVLHDERWMDAKNWDKHIPTMADIVWRKCIENKIEYLLTFDESGITNHPNHISCHDVVNHLMKTKKPQNMEAYKLISIHNLRTYLGMLDALPTVIAVILSRLRPQKDDQLVYVHVNPAPSTCAKLFDKAHFTQFVWYRWLKVMFQRYCFVNTLQKIPKDGKI